ncbi:MAG: polysaccharide biosynthesis/export family protein [Planctomycetota bacterium]|nr:MAG: polysaccharide biosynthesis/export family protein [Planctomycetota bacterium]
MRLGNIISKVFHNIWLVAFILLPCTGCVSSWWNAFLDPSQLGNFRENRVSEILRTISFRDKPYGITNAVDPTPDDLVITVEPYRIGPGDQLSIRILDFLGQNIESEFTPAVDELGNIGLPQLPTIRVEGMTARDLEDRIKQLSKDADIFPEHKDPIVTVSFINQQQRMYNIAGSAVTRPGAYPIIRPDYRLKEAINMAGGLGDMVKTVYVIREEKKTLRTPQNNTDTIISAPDRDSELRPPPVMPQTFAEMAAGPGQAAAPEQNQQPTSRDAQPKPLSLPAQQVQKELIDAVAPVQTKPIETPVLRQKQTSPQDTAPPLPPFIFVDDRFVETTKPPPSQPETQKFPVTTEPVQPQKTVDWEELAADIDQQRIIKIPADRLRKNDSNYNIIIKSGDWIQLETGPVGVYYVMGQISRPGFARQFDYTFNGEEITLTQALASVGGLGPLAWPTRCEIKRRLEDDRQEITQWNLERIVNGLDPDIYIRPGDVINVGTHAIAQLLQAIRNGLRVSYGFSFSYDRNFADIDSFAGQQNPDTRRRAEVAARFPGLFP